MTSLMQLERERNQAFRKLQDKKDELYGPLPQDMFSLVAQEVNDAWIEYKKKNIEFNNVLVKKQMGDLYGC